MKCIRTLYDRRLYHANDKSKIEIWLDDDDFASEFLDKTADNPLDNVLKMELAKEVLQTLATLKPIHSDAIRLRKIKI